MTVDWARIRTLELAAVVCAALERRGIRATLVGGACVAIHSDGRYVSRDLDFVTESPLERVREALAELGFSREGRMFRHPECRSFWLDFPAPPLSVGSSPPFRVDELRTPRGTVRLLSPTDTVCDRLAAYYHWDDPQGLEQALLVASSREVDMRRVRVWSRAGKHMEKFRVFEGRLRKRGAAEEKP